jgi:tight adherence protein C
VTTVVACLGLVAVWAWALSGTVSRVRGRRLVRHRLRRDGRARRPDPLAALGHVVLGSVTRLRSRGAPHVAGDGDARRVGTAVVGLAAVTVSPVVGAGIVLAAVGPPLAQRRRRPAAALAVAVRSLPDTIDLLAVAARAGLPASAAVTGVAERAPPPWGPALDAVVHRTRRGERFVEALDELARVGGGNDVGHGLRSLLRSAAEDGADLVAGLDRLAADARDLRRRRAEEAARRVPVRLLLPLVACSLPAFALLTIVPIVAGALQALDL